MRGGEAGTTASRAAECARGGPRRGFAVIASLVLSASVLGVSGDCQVPARMYEGGVVRGNCPEAGGVMGVGDECVVRCEEWLIMDPPEGNMLRCHAGMAVPTATYNTSAPPCRAPVACDTQADPYLGDIGNCTYVEDMQSCEINCPAGRVANATSHCRNGVLEPAECIPQPCVDFAVPLNGTAGSCAGPLQSGDECSWACDYGFHPEGSATCDFGTWSNTATCVLDTCDTAGPGFGQLGDGMGNCPATLSHGESCTQACAKGYVISGPAFCDNSTFVSGSCLLIDQCPVRNSLGYCECPMHHHVFNHSCVECPIGTYTHVPHPAHGDDTVCELVPTVDPQERLWYNDEGKVVGKQQAVDVNGHIVATVKVADACVPREGETVQSISRHCTSRYKATPAANSIRLNNDIPAAWGINDETLASLSSYVVNVEVEIDIFPYECYAPRNGSNFTLVELDPLRFEPLAKYQDWVNHFQTYRVGMGEGVGEDDAEDTFTSILNFYHHGEEIPYYQETWAPTPAPTPPPTAPPTPPPNHWAPEDSAELVRRIEYCAMFEANSTSVTRPMYNASTGGLQWGEGGVDATWTNFTGTKCKAGLEDTFISNWDTRAVTDMSELFLGAHAFSVDIGKWNTANVVDMSRMFMYASSFNGNVSGWNISQVESVENLFANATAFDQDLSTWNLTSDTLAMGWLDGVPAYDSGSPGKGYNCQTVLGEYNISTCVEVQTDNTTEYNCTHDFGTYYYTTPESCAGIECAASDIAAVISATANATLGDCPANGTLAHMGTCSPDCEDGFYPVGRLLCRATQVYTTYTSDGDTFGCVAAAPTVPPFPAPAERRRWVPTWPRWESVPLCPLEYLETTPTYQALLAENGNAHPLDPVDLSLELSGCEPFTADDKDAIVDALRTCAGGYGSRNAAWRAWGGNCPAPCLGCSTYCPIRSWNVSLLTDMDGLFAGASVFDEDIGGWDVSSVTSMNAMFQGASAFNQNISAWDVGLVANFSNMFDGAKAFSQELGQWNIAQGANLTEMFQGATSMLGSPWSCQSTPSWDGTSLDCTW